MTVREAIVASLAVWGEIYPNIRFGELTPDAWERVLADLSPEGIVYAFNRALKESQFPTLPPVGLVREYAALHDTRIRTLVCTYAYLAARGQDLSEDDKHCLRSCQEQLARLPASLLQRFTGGKYLVPVHRPAPEEA